MSKLKPIHPGTILLEEFLKPLNIEVPKSLQSLVEGKTGVTAELAAELSSMLGTSKDFWLNLQKNYECRSAEIE